MISVVVPAYRNPDDVRALVASLEAQCRSGVPYEVVVVDDGSGDPGFDEVARGHAQVRLVRLAENGGAAAARNAGARAAAYDVVLFMDSDMQVLTDAVRVTADLFRDPGVVAVVGAVDPQPANPTPFTRFWALVKAFSLPQGGYSSTFYPMIGAIRKALFLEVGGFDERIRGASVEDYEISIRLRARNVRVHYSAGLCVRTHYYTMFRSLRQSFERCGKWLLLGTGGGARFDNHTTTVSQAVGMVTGALVPASLALAVFVPWALLVVAALLVVYIGVNIRFLRYAAEHAGAAFLPQAVFFHLCLSMVVSAGVARVVPYLVASPERRRQRVNG